MCMATATQEYAGHGQKDPHKQAFWMQGLSSNLFPEEKNVKRLVSVLWTITTFFIMAYHLIIIGTFPFTKGFPMVVIPRVLEQPLLWALGGTSVN